MKKFYRIAQLVVQMDVSGRTLQQAAPYEIEWSGPADIEIEFDPAEVLRNAPDLETEELAEYVTSGVVFARRMLNFDGYYLHSSAVVLDGKAYLFTAPSGTGKSTHTENWIRLFGAHYLNDDKPILRKVEGQWIAFGTPWSGKYDLSTNEGVPVGGIACLRRGEKNEINPMSPASALRFFMSQTLQHLRAEQIEKKLALIDTLLKDVPVWDLACLPDEAAAIMAKNAMTGQMEVAP